MVGRCLLLHGDHWLHWSTRVEGSEAGNGVLAVVGTSEIALWDTALVNELNLILEYRDYIGLVNLGTNLNSN